MPLLTQTMLHRGPDAQNTAREGIYQMHHHRLAIIDVACGHQPMYLGELSLIFNGEIYNHLAVRKQYELECKTQSDTETLLHLYKKIGAACLEPLDGMFAFAIHDKKKNQLFIARDRAGKKPLYYYHDGKKFVFASELNALRNELPLEIDEDHIRQFLRMGYFYKTATPYKNVFELPAGSYAFVDLDTVKVDVKKWWSIHPFYLKKSNDDFETALAKTERILKESVRRRVEASDLEVGSFLSGGIDSGLVTAFAKEYNQSLKTFTVSFEGAYDEAPLAKQVATKYATDHHEIRISFDNLVNDVEKILENYGEPFMDSSAIPSYYVSKEAKKHLTVILNGDGGDEIFGGYRRYVAFSKFDFFRSGGAVKHLSRLGHSLLPPPQDKKSKYNFVYRLLDLARKNDLEVYLSATIDSFDGYEQYLLQDDKVLTGIRQDFAKINDSHLTGLQKIMNLDFDNILPGDLLVKMDIATMAHSLEGRSPLLSKDVLEYLPTLPDSYKIKGSETKRILRALAAKYLPPDLVNQPKRGFEIPLKSWIDNELKELIGSYILPRSAYCSKFVKPGFVQQLWDRKIKVGDEKRAKMIWTLFALEVWYQRVFLRMKDAVS